jgi:serine/threonine protein kinase
MELMPGGSLQDRLDHEGPLPVPAAVDAILDVIEGLEAAQRTGIVHRDIKPSNCFVDDVGRVRIGDFGISRGLELDPALTRLTATGAFLGTYAALRGALRPYASSTLPPAEPVRRSVAYLCDCVILVPVLSAARASLGLVSPLEVAGGIHHLLDFAVTVAYFAVLEGWLGWTLG